MHRQPHDGRDRRQRSWHGVAELSRWSLVIDEGDREIVLARFERKAD
jgi:hypothetical protein